MEGGKEQMPISEITNVMITESMIENYCGHLAKSGKTFHTLNTYARTIRQLYDFLPGNKNCSEETLNQWELELKNRGYAKTTVSSQLSIANGFLLYTQATKHSVGNQEIERKCLLNRDKYLLLLQTARTMGHRRAYLLIKTIVTAGVRNMELRYLTVEALNEGFAVLISRDLRRKVPIPNSLRAELLEYAAEQGILSGPVFVTQEGNPMKHSAVVQEIRRVRDNAWVDEEFGTPRGLYMMYLETYQKVCRDSSTEDAFHEYEQLLSKEEELVAWNR